MINRINISLLEFIRTGKFGDIFLGQSMEYIRNHFPEPDDIWDAGHDCYIWRYGVFEFHFMSGVLTLLWCDDIDNLENPDKNQFILDKWILNDSNKLTFSYFCSRLDQENIPYTCSETFSKVEKQSLPESIIVSVANTDSILYFEDSEETADSLYDYTLVAIGASVFKQQNVYPL